MQLIFKPHLLLIAFFCVAPSYVLAQCSRNEFGFFEDINCAAEALASAEKELNSAYQKLIVRLEPKDKKLLMQSQKNWQKFLSSEVAFIYSVEGNGSSGRLVVANTLEKFNSIRARDLDSWNPRN